jgi:hypothetical protein
VTPRQSQIREAAIERYLRKAFRQAGGELLKFVSPNRKGVPDRVGFIPRRAMPWFIEFKRPGGTVEVLQRRAHAMLRKYGQNVAVIDSMEEADRFIESYLTRR